MKLAALLCCLGIPLVAASSALGADAEAGRRVAQQECAACHIVGPSARQELADSPPFEMIGRKFGFNYDMLVLAILGPHRKMNFSPRRSEAEDLAAYMVTLRR
jgi:mono/diheme cytochrome c family protein